MHQLDGDGARDADLRWRADGLRRQERQGRTNTLPGAAGRRSVRLHVPEVVLGRSAQIRVQRRQSGHQDRIDEPLGSAQHVGRDGDTLHHAGTSSDVRVKSSA